MGQKLYRALSTDVAQTSPSQWIEWGFYRAMLHCTATDTSTIFVSDSRRRRRAWFCHSYIPRFWRRSLLRTLSCRPSSVRTASETVSSSDARTWLGGADGFARTIALIRADTLAAAILSSLGGWLWWIASCGSVICSTAAENKHSFRFVQEIVWLTCIERIRDIADVLYRYRHAVISQ